LVVNGRKWGQRLTHILESIAEIQSYTSGRSFEEFCDNSMMRFASIKQMEIIGEAANHISDETKNKFSEIEWRQITGMRNILVHEYFGIDVKLIWEIAIADIPELKNKIEKVIQGI